MRKLLALFMLQAIITTVQSQVVWEIKETGTRKWAYYFGDEFSSNSIDEKKWHIGPPYGKANKRLETYFLKENVSIKNNEAYIFVDTQKMMKPIEPWLIDSAYLKKKNISPVNGLYSFNYSSGMLWSKDFFKYGYFELRVKVEKGRGTWPSFWMYGKNQKDELDFFELKGERLNQIHVDVHCKNGCDAGYKSGMRKVNWSGWVSIYDYLNNGYNTVSGIWEPGEVTFFLNGYMIGKFKGGFDTPMSLIVSTGVTQDDFAFAPGPDKTTPFPCGMHVDYVRVFGSPDTVKTKPNIAFSYITDTTNIIQPKKIKTKKYIYNRKRDDNVQGFISYYPLNHKTLLFEVKGKISSSKLTITNASGTEIVSQDLKYTFNEVDISKAGHGDCTMRITVNDKKVIEEKIHLGH